MRKKEGSISKQIHIGDVKIPSADMAVARNAILGITRSGKTYCAKGEAEQFLDAGVPIIVFDAIGVWRYLKTPGDGPNAKGYPIVVAGGEHADLPLTVQSAPEIVRAAMRDNVPLVIDLYDPKLSKSDWRKIVQSCFRTLLYENKSVRHIFLEEAAEYAPQKIMDGETYAEVEKLARMGGNKGLGITFINQRAQELNKAVLELSDNMILLRQRGSHAIGSLEKWLDRVSPDIAKEIATSLPHMTQGDCWVWTEASDRPVRTRTNPIRSFHPDRRTLNEAEVARKSVYTGKFVAKMAGELGKLVEQAKANDPAALKRRIAELEKQLSTRPKEQVEKVVEKIVEVPVLKNGHLDRTEKILGRLQEFADKALAETSELRRLIAPAAAPRPATKLAAVAHPVQRPTQAARVAPTVRVRPSDESEGSLSKGERAILIATAQHSEGVTRDQLTVLCGYKRSSRDTYLQRLKEKGFVDQSGETIFATDDGVAAIGPDYEPLPTGDALREHWLSRLSGGEKVILEALVNSFPESVSRESLSESTNYQRSSRDTYLQRLASRKLVENVGRGEVRAAHQLFDGAIA